MEYMYICRTIQSVIIIVIKNPMVMPYSNSLKRQSLVRTRTQKSEGEIRQSAKVLNTLHIFFLPNNHSLESNSSYDDELNQEQRRKQWWKRCFIYRFIRFDHHLLINSFNYSITTVYFGATHIWIQHELFVLAYFVLRPAFTITVG